MLISERGVYYMYLTPEQRYNSKVKQGDLMRFYKPNSKEPSKTIFKQDEINFNLYYEKMECRITNKG